MSDFEETTPVDPFIGRSGTNGHGSDPSLRIANLKDHVDRLDRAVEHHRGDIGTLSGRFDATEAAIKRLDTRMLVAHRELGTQVMGLYWSKVYGPVVAAVVGSAIATVAVQFAIQYFSK